MCLSRLVPHTRSRLLGVAQGVRLALSSLHHSLQVPCRRFSSARPCLVSRAPYPRIRLLMPPKGSHKYLPSPTEAALAGNASVLRFFQRLPPPPKAGRPPGKHVEKRGRRTKAILLCRSHNNQMSNILLHPWLPLIRTAQQWDPQCRRKRSEQRRPQHIT